MAQRKALALSSDKKNLEEINSLAQRKPIVLIDGRKTELPAGDTLVGAGAVVNNVIGYLKSGVSFGSRLILKSPLLCGVMFKIAPVYAVAKTLAGISFTGKNSGTVKPPVKAGISLSNKSGGTIKPPAQIGFKIVQTTISLVRTVGANSVTQEAVAGRSDWTNPANAAGRKNATVAAFAGNLTAARSGRLIFAYAPSLNKTALTITNVTLNFYLSQTGTLAGNGSLKIGYRFGGGGILQQLAAYTADQNSLTTPVSFNLGTTLSWADIDSLQYYAECSTAAANNSAANVDAVEVVIQANRTDVL